MHKLVIVAGFFFVVGHPSSPFDLPAAHFTVPMAVEPTAGL
jgi:hypothetical protein